jgi:hypothetical protein
LARRRFPASLPPRVAHVAVAVVTKLVNIKVVVVVVIKIVFVIVVSKIVVEVGIGVVRTIVALGAPRPV